MNAISRPSIDPVTLEVTRNKLDGIANEMQWTLLNSSFSPIVKEGMDASAGLFTADGTTLAQATAIPIHLVTLIPCMENILRTFPVAEMAEGDAYCMNDPYAGGTHIPDIAVVMPVFHDGKVIAFSATMTHHQDLGGMSPGSVPTNATDLFQEGFQIPALRLLHRGVPNETLVALLRLNVRIPDTTMGDLNAQIAACRVGARRLTELVNSLGPVLLIQAFTTLLDRSEAMTRAALRTLPEGTWRSVDYLDNDGVELDRRVRIEVAVTLRDGTIHLDFTGTAPELRGPFNVVPSGTLAAACFAVRALTDPVIPTNGGCFRPVSLHLPEGSLVNPRKPAPVNARSMTIKAITNNIIGALAEAVPDRVAGFNSAVHVFMFGGRRSDGAGFVMGEIVSGGTGAWHAGDGCDAIEGDSGNSMNMPVEAIEMDFPLRILRAELRPDSGGAGAFRGGLGVCRDYLVLADGVTFTHRGDRHFSDPPGVLGGGPGKRARSVILRRDGREEVIPSKCVTRLDAGDRLKIEIAGAGGFGVAAERSRASVAMDVRNGKISEAAAREEYGFIADNANDRGFA